MTAPTLRQLMADVIADLGFTNGDELVIADALLASPELQAIIDLALVGMVDGLYADPPTEIRALLVDWLAPEPNRNRHHESLERNAAEPRHWKDDND